MEHRLIYSGVYGPIEYGYDIHHIDGNCLNNDESNLQVLCPNCHAMTENFGSRNKNAAPGRSKYFRRG